MGLDKEKGLEVGDVEFHEISSKFNLTKLFQKHVSILAQSGAGKSHCVSVLIEELLDRNEDLGKPAIIVIDPHGEYIGFAEDPKYQNRTKILDKKSLKISANQLSANQISEFQPFISAVERRDLNKIIKNLRDQKIAYDMDELISAIELSDIKPNVKSPLLSWLSDLNSIGFFSNYDSPSLEELARMDQLTVVDLSDFVHLKEKQIIVTHLARRLFEARRANKIPPFIFILEEAHQFIPEQVDSSRAISKNIMETIAREGRKFHSSLVLVSQRPIQLSTTALSQCNSSIILRISNPYDIKHIGESIEGVTSDIMNMLPGLKVGEAIVTGEVVNYPILIQVRDRKSKKSEKGIRLEDALLKFNEKVLKNKKDLDTF